MSKKTIIISITSAILVLSLLIFGFIYVLRTETKVDPLPTNSWLERIDWNNTTTFDSPKPYPITNESFSFPLDYDNLITDETLYVLDYNTYNDGIDFHFIPYSEFYGSTLANWEVPVFKCLGEGETMDNSTQTIGAISGDTSGTLYKFQLIGVFAFLYDGTFNETNIPSTQVGANCLSQNGFVFTTNIEYDTALRNQTNIDKLNDLIINYLGRPTYIYSSCNLEDISKQNSENLINTHIVWQYSDGQCVTLQCREQNTSDGIKLQIVGLSYSPAEWKDDESWIMAIDMLKNAYIDVTNQILK